jgi:hypothetical protein
VSDGLTEDSTELRTTSTVRRALSETLPEAVAAAAYEFITGHSSPPPTGSVKGFSHRWTTVLAPGAAPTV